MKVLNKTTLFKAVFLMTLVLSFTACSDDDKETFDLSEYQLKEMLWKMDEGDKIADFKQSIGTHSLINGTSLPMTMTIKPFENIEESSQFYCDNPDMLNTLTSTHKALVSYPSLTLASTFDSTYKSIVGGSQAPFDLNKNIIEPTSQSSVSYEVLPGHSMDVTGEVNLIKITASYKAIFTSPYHARNIEITGKWVGIFQHGCNVSAINQQLPKKQNQ